MNQIELTGRRFPSAMLAVAWSALAFILACNHGAKTATGQTIDYFNDLPEIQMWTYPIASANGPGSVRDRGSTFSAFSETQNGSPTFFQGTGAEPTRRGSILVAANTSTSVPLVDPSRYQINSLKIKMTLLGSLILPEFDLTLPYDGTLDESSAVVDDTDGDAGHPIEMYGVGFQNGLTTFGFGATPPANSYALRQPRWVGSAPYNYYAVDANGRDAENSLVGGYSATEATQTTAAFTPVPFAIGKVFDGQGAELQPGTLLATGDVFEFVPNLNNPAILEYVQESLAGGHLGFTFSSLFEPDGQSGSVAYPDFYLDDLDVGPNPSGSGPTVALNVTILPEGPTGPAGDYNGDGTVDGADFLVWQRNLGTVATPSGSGADGNGNGSVDAGDLDVWKDHFGETPPPIAAVPEPATAMLALVGALALIQRRRSRSLSIVS
jgi:hypothetical protein